MKKKIAVLLAVLLTAVCLCCTASAFDANDYDFGGGDWGGGSDWGSSDWSSDWGSDYSHSYGTGSGSVDDDPVGIIIGVAFVVLFLIIGTMVTKKSNKGGGSTQVGGGVRPANGGQGRNVNVPDRTAEIERVIKQTDPLFTADDFTSFAKQVYIDIQTAWCARDLTPVRPVMHTNLYNTTAKQVQSKIDQGVIYHYESIAINTAYLTSFVRDEQFEYLTVYLNARFIDYQTDEKTGNLIRGDRNTRWDFRYKMKFMRTAGMKTKDANVTDGHNCPNCGAPLEISSTGKCAYCGSTVTTGMYSWVLSDFTTVRDDTKDDGIRVPPPPAPPTTPTQGQGTNADQAQMQQPGAGQAQRMQPPTSAQSAEQMMRDIANNANANIPYGMTPEQIQKLNELRNNNNNNNGQ